MERVGTCDDGTRLALCDDGTRLGGCGPGPGCFGYAGCHTLANLRGAVLGLACVDVDGAAELRELDRPLGPDRRTLPGLMRWASLSTATSDGGTAMVEAEAWLCFAAIDGINVFSAAERDAVFGQLGLMAYPGREVFTGFNGLNTGVEVALFVAWRETAESTGQPPGAFGLRYPEVTVTPDWRPRIDCRLPGAYPLPGAPACGSDSSGGATLGHGAAFTAAAGDLSWTLGATGRRVGPGTDNLELAVQASLEVVEPELFYPAAFVPPAGCDPPREIAIRYDRCDGAGPLWLSRAVFDDLGGPVGVFKLDGDCHQYVGEEEVLSCAVRTSTPTLEGPFAGCAGCAAIECAVMEPCADPSQTVLMGLGPIDAFPGAGDVYRVGGGCYRKVGETVAVPGIVSPNVTGRFVSCADCSGGAGLMVRFRRCDGLLPDVQNLVYQDEWDAFVAGGGVPDGARVIGFPGNDQTCVSIPPAERDLPRTAAALPLATWLAGKRFFSSCTACRRTPVDDAGDLDRPLDTLTAPPNPDAARMEAFTGMGAQHNRGGCCG